MILIQYTKYCIKLGQQSVNIAVTDITNENNDNNNIPNSMINTLINAKYIQTAR